MSAQTVYAYSKDGDPVQGWGPCPIRGVDAPGGECSFGRREQLVRGWRRRPRHCIAGCHREASATGCSTKHELQKIAGAMDDIVLKLTDTRWLDHRKRAMAVLEKDHGSLVSQFEDLGSGKRKDVSAGDAAKMLGYVKKIKCAKCILYLASCQDYGDDLAKLS